MSDATEHTEDDIVLAGEYALHLLDADARLAFERRLGQEPALRALLAEWDEGLVPLTDEIPSEAPPRRLKSKIEAELFGGTSPKRGRQGFWATMLGGALAAAALAVAVFFYSGPPTTNLPALAAEIAAEDRSLVFTARFDPSSGRLEVERLEGAPAPGRDHELWLIAEGASTPVSLGVLPAERVSIELPENLMAALVGGTLAVSDEPPGGSPTGQVTGPVVAAGPVVAG